MKNNCKNLILAAAIILTVSTASAEIALTVPETSKEIEGFETSYRIGLINTGSDQRNISFTVDSPEVLNIAGPKTVSLPPSELSSSPEEDGWYQAAPGRYVKIRYAELNASVDIDRADKRRFNFSVLASTSREASISRPEVSSVNQLDFILRSRSSEIDTGFEGSLWQESGREGEKEVRKSSEKASEGVESKPDNSTQRPDNRTVEDEVDGEDSRPESVTIILVLGIVLTAGYVLLEV